ncbi:MAG: hypothetical protein M0Z66_16010 [Thermaerobacter sp.]|nr:hypothetical protein [Thermaerobacter sp.]
MVDLGNLQYHAHNPGHIARRIRRLPAADRNALRDRYEYGPVDLDFGDNLIAACQQMGWRLR